MTSVIASVVACNQTLTIMLTEQLCCHTEENKNKLAIYLENSAVVIAPLVPWSIAGSVPLTSAGAPLLSVVFAVFLYILPLYSLGTSVYENKKIKNRMNGMNSESNP
jgi:NhaC family Na+:H+ antiporter